MRLTTLGLALAIAVSASAEMAGPTQLPGARVIKNLEARIAKEPKSADLHYLLGRAHYTLYCYPEDGKIRLYGSETDPQFPSDHPSPREFLGWPSKKDALAIAHIRAGIKHLQTAVKLGGGMPGLYHLTLACAYEAAAPEAERVEKGKDSKHFHQLALQHFVASFQASRATDRKQQYLAKPMTYEKWISVEAGESVLRLDPRNPLKVQIEEHLAFIAKLPNGPITPLVFSLTEAKPLEDLLDPFAIVNFDLDGTGAPQSYSWVKPDTAFLVWQPDPRVPVTSGRQLFGSATWWMMNRDAYSAMSLLDNNFDGWLTRRELLGLSVWQDRNQNGKAESREVRTVQSVGIAALRTIATGRTGASLVSTDGLRLRNGKRLPTYDWVTQPL